MKHIVMQHHLIKKHEISCTWAGEGEQSDSGKRAFLHFSGVRTGVDHG
jgi:hypothetical protein